MIQLLLLVVNFCFENPGSTTYTIPSIVKEVSAMFVDIMTLRPGLPLGFGLVGAGSKSFVVDEVVMNHTMDKL